MYEWWWIMITVPNLILISFTLCFYKRVPERKPVPPNKPPVVHPKVPNSKEVMEEKKLRPVPVPTTAQKKLVKRDRIYNTQQYEDDLTSINRTATALPIRAKADDDTIKHVKSIEFDLSE